MKTRRLFLYAGWLAVTALLYFFENNTGTRIVLAGTLLLPLLSGLRRLLPASGHASGRGRGRFFLPLTLKTFRSTEEDLSETRLYRPGDPPGRIHWKLSAKREELLVRVPAPERQPEDSFRELPANTPGKTAGLRYHPALLLSAVFAAACLLLALLPEARLGFQALCNRLFDASEAVNAYRYERFPVSPEQPAAAAAVLLCTALLCLAGAALSSRRCLPVLGLAAASAAFQAYFGLSFPAPVNAVLFTLLGLCLLYRASGRVHLRVLAAALILSCLAVPLLRPGVDPAVEAASERARDALSRAVSVLSGTVSELPEGETETRHVHTRSLQEGAGEARPEREFRLITLEEEQVSMPRWVDMLRIALLLLLLAAVLILPFLPFMVLSARRRRLLKTREALEHGEIREGLLGAFQQTVLLLEAAGSGAGNLPYREWGEHLALRFSPDYVGRFSACALLFEEAAYSTHPMQEPQRALVLGLLRETGRALLESTRGKQRLRLKCMESLWQ